MVTVNLLDAARAILYILFVVLLVYSIYAVRMTVVSLKAVNVVTKRVDEITLMISDGIKTNEDDIAENFKKILPMSSQTSMFIFTIISTILALRNKK